MDCLPPSSYHDFGFSIKEYKSLQEFVFTRRVPGQGLARLKFVDCPQLRDIDTATGSRGPQPVAITIRNGGNVKQSVKFAGTLKLDIVFCEMGSLALLSSGPVTTMTTEVCGCSRLKSVDVPELSLPSPSSGTKTVVVLSFSFRDCAALTDFRLPPLPDETKGRQVSLSLSFEDCGSLSSLVLPSVLVVSKLELTFKNCAQLQSVTLPASTLSLFELKLTVHDCALLRGIQFPSKLTGGVASKGRRRVHPSLKLMFKNCAALQEVTLPPDIELVSLRLSACKCDKLQKIGLPKDAMTKRMTLCLSGCPKLASMLYPIHEAAHAGQCREEH